MVFVVLDTNTKTNFKTTKKKNKHTFRLMISSYDTTSLENFSVAW